MRAVVARVHVGQQVAVYIGGAGGIESELFKGKDGVFEVTVDGDLIYSKNSNGRFPEPGEVEGALGELLGG